MTHITFDDIFGAIKTLSSNSVILTHTDNSIENLLKNELLELSSKEKGNILIAFDTFSIDI